ncbi:extracellular solute-binding protein [Phytomonospora endophytica]|uniref:Putative aldouronate transport system substrate-binding protein n=1 Tax=Phytomonospora endophytica TaxID=714109 RepID=A0A841FBE0_9ACTN|nr:extracellular solute-binding protein [Phytomonospora endophytica]MBB6032333.1 putative aldouronate transport system substrate-binding protein [Phytomonospora endophytica]GIG68681.1 sugar ABC transporter substrate-binding protein [Phytomonospora endophytica]
MKRPLTAAAVDRRGFLSLLGVGALATTSGGLLAACGSGGGGAGDQGMATQTDKLLQLMPTYKPVELIPPDIAGVGGAPNGYLSYPRNLVQAITETPGTSGKEISAMAPHWGTVPPALGGNAYYDAINTRLGVPVKFSLQDGVTYYEKLNTILGAKDVPEVLSIPSWNVAGLAHFSDAAEALFTDLTPHLQGDKALTYPMLANLPTKSWLECIWNGKLMAVPFPSDGFAWGFFYRKDIFTKLGAVPPTTAQELYDLGKAVTDPNAKRWAFGAITWEVERLFGSPGTQEGWRKNPDGTVVNKIETPEYAAAIEFMTKLFTDGLVHPEMMNSTGDAKQLFNSGEMLMTTDGFGGWEGALATEPAINPEFDMQPVLPYSHDGKATPIIRGGGKVVFYSFIRKDLSEDRVKEILRVMNWCGAPYGSQEAELIQFGVEGQHFTRGADGTPVKNDLGNTEVAAPYAGISGAPAIITPAKYFDKVQARVDWNNAAMPFMEKDPWEGIRLEIPSKVAALKQPTEDKINDIIRGRTPLSELESIKKEWLQKGGEEGREFYAKALSDNGR